MHPKNYMSSIYTLNFGKDKVLPLFFKMFIPTLFGMLSMAAVTAINGVFVGHGIGSDGLAAVNITVPLWMIFSGIGLMLGAGCSVLASANMAQGRYRLAKMNVSVAFTYATIITLCVAVLVMVFPYATACFFGASDTLVPLVRDYLIFVMPCFVFQMWSSIGLFIIRLDGAPKIAMWCNVITAILTLVGDWLMIFVFNAGLKGVAVATSISIIIGGAIAGVYILFYARNLKYSLGRMSKKIFRKSWNNLCHQCKIGSSSLLGECMMAVLVFVGNYVFMRYLGDNGVGAFGIACYYTPFIFMVGNAIIQSAQPIISYNNSTNNSDRVLMITRLVFGTALVCGVLITFIFVCIPVALVHLYVSADDPAAQIAIDGMPYFATGTIFFIVNVCIIGYYQSLEKMKQATLLMSLRGLIILIPVFLILPALFGVKGIWIAMPVSEIMTFCIAIVIWKCSKPNK